MRHSSIALLAVAAACATGTGGLHTPTPAQIAEAVVGDDLKHLPDGARTRALDALRTLSGNPGGWRAHDDGSPHRLFRWSGSTTRWVLVVTDDGVEIPGTSWMAVHQFDAAWRQMSVVSFPTGYRMRLVDAWQADVDALPEPVIAAQLDSVSFRYRERQYYAVREGRVAKVRIEKASGELARANFNGRHPDGPKLPSRTADDWIELLASKDTVDVLEVLTWLGGSHLSSTRPRRVDVNEESVADSRLWETVRDHPRTATRITSLQASANAWVCAAARLAASVERDQ